MSTSHKSAVQPAMRVLTRAATYRRAMSLRVSVAGDKPFMFVKDKKAFTLHPSSQRGGQRSPKTVLFSE